MTGLYFLADRQAIYKTRRIPLRPPKMRRLPRWWPLSRLKGASPARAAIFWRSSCPNSGISASTVTAVILPTPGMLSRCWACSRHSGRLSTSSLIWASSSSIRELSQFKYGRGYRLACCFGGSQTILLGCAYLHQLFSPVALPAAALAAAYPRWWQHRSLPRPCGGAAPHRDRRRRPRRPSPQASSRPSRDWCSRPVRRRLRDQAQTSYESSPSWPDSASSSASAHTRSWPSAHDSPCCPGSAPCSRSVTIAAGTTPPRDRAGVAWRAVATLVTPLVIRAMDLRFAPLPETVTPACASVSVSQTPHATFVP